MDALQVQKRDTADDQEIFTFTGHFHYDDVMPIGPHLESIDQIFQNVPTRRPKRQIDLQGWKRKNGFLGRETKTKEAIAPVTVQKANAK